MPRSPLSSWDDAVESFFRHRHDLQPLSVRYYRGALRRFQQATGAKSIADLNSESVNQYVASVRKSKHMARGDCAVLKVFGKWLVKARILSHDPLEAVTTPDAPKSRPKPFTAEVAHAIIELSGDSRMAARDRAIVVLTMDSGARPWEIGQLTWPEDVDLNNGVIYIRGEQIKNDQSRGREIVIGHKAVAVLDEYVKDYRPQIPGPLFLSMDGGPLSYGGFMAIHKRLRNYLIRRGIKGYSAYRNRHTGITFHARTPGITMADVQRRAGHSSAITTMGYMGGRSVEEQRRLRSGFDIAMGV